MSKANSTQAFDPVRLVRDCIRQLEPYHSARGEHSGGQDLLDANENSYGSVVEDEQLALNRYPDPHQKRLRQRYAEFRGVEPGQVFAGVGSDEAIDLLMRIFCEPGRDQVVITPPTYGMYKVSAGIQNVEVIESPLTPDFGLDAERLLGDITERTRIVFLCSPNNPTGNCLDPGAIEQVLKRFNGIVVVDEAYIDFASRPGLSGWLGSYPNLVLLQTFSKAFGLAAARAGVALADRRIIEQMLKIKPPYNLNAWTLRTAEQALENTGRLDTMVKEIRRERGRLARELERLPVVEHIWPSEANFLLVRVTGARQVYDALARQGIMVRYRGNQPHCENALRVTVGTPNQNNRLIQALQLLDP